MRWDVLAIGQPYVDLSLRVPTIPRLNEDIVAQSARRCAGGCAANVAAAASALGLRAAVAGPMARDADGRAYTAELVAMGIDVVELPAGPEASTGFCMVLVDQATATPTYVTHLGRGLRWEAAPLRDAVDSANAVYLSAYELLGEGAPEALLSATASLRHSGRLLVVDLCPIVGWPALPPGLHPLLYQATVIAGTQAEFDALAGHMGLTRPELVSRLLNHGARQVHVKLGPDGAEVHTADGRIRAPGIAVDAVDTTGAGDAYCAGVLSACLWGEGPEGAAVSGVRCGAIACTILGGNAHAALLSGAKEAPAKPLAADGGIAHAKVFDEG